MPKIEMNPQLSDKKAKKIYQTPVILWLGDLPKGSGKCGTGGSPVNDGTCTDGTAAGAPGCADGFGGAPL